MVAKKLLLDDKITPCVKQICLLGVKCKVSNTKHGLVKYFVFLENVCCQYFNLCFEKIIGFFFLPAAD